jgi:hypothetical protein
LTISTGFLFLLYILIFSACSLFISSMLILVLASLYQNRTRAIVQYFLYFFIYILFFTLVYWKSNLYVYSTIFIVIGAGFLVFRSWNRNWQTWDQILNRYRPVEKKSSQMLSKLTYFNFPVTISKSLKPILVKELLSHIRNKNYLRLKIISIALYLTIIILFDIFYFDYFTSTISVLTIILIWEHYSHQFNEKYVLKESLSFIKVLPVTYFQYGMSKFLSEFFYIILILFIILILTILHHIEWIQILNILGIVTLFAIFVLYIITIIRVIFYDNPRMAGYAYHFLIIFTLVMIFNFYLVGPLITIFIIVYIQFSSYRQFTK